MLRILQFLYGLRSFLLFVLLEALAISLLVSNNSPQGAAFYNSSNKAIGSLLETRSEAINFFAFAETNEALNIENARLIQLLQNLKKSPDSVYFELDSVLLTQFKFKAAKVFNNSLRFSQNHLTLNKGSKHGMKPGMGIFNEDGIIGRIKSVSENYSVGISLLNTGLLISSKLKSTENFGSVNWDGASTEQAKMLYVPRHVKVFPGDTIVTSGYNGVFPEGIQIGVVAAVNPGSDSNYLDILIDLSTDFTSLNYVYVVENTNLVELDSLYKKSELVNEF
jgi:rod shape-determining protein MreC